MVHPRSYLAGLVQCQCLYLELVSKPKCNSHLKEDERSFILEVNASGQRLKTQIQVSPNSMLQHSNRFVKFYINVTDKPNHFKYTGGNIRWAGHSEAEKFPYRPQMLTDTTLSLMAGRS